MKVLTTFFQPTTAILHFTLTAAVWTASSITLRRLFLSSPLISPTHKVQRANQCKGPPQYAPAPQYSYSQNGGAYLHNSGAYGYGRPAPPPQQMQSFGQGAPQGYQFQYSNCTGKRKALLIGINYFGQRGQLKGCINDVKNMSTYLNQHFGYRREDMVTLTDDAEGHLSVPTKANIIRAMHWLVKDAQPNDSLFFHYSGT